MKTNATEIAAVAAAAAPRPRQTRLEAETAAFLADMDVIAEQINSTPRDVRMERSAAVLAECVSVADAEAVRAAYWTKAPLAARMVAVMAARLPKDRANGALNTFDALERGLVWNGIEKLIQWLTVIQKCMNGGAMPKSKGAVH
jgi:hypothetical protein